MAKVTPPPGLVDEMCIGAIPGSYEEKMQAIRDVARAAAESEGLYSPDTAHCYIEATFGDKVIVCVEKWRGSDKGTKYYSLPVKEKDGKYVISGSPTQVEVKAVVKAKKEAAVEALGLVFSEESDSEVTLTDIVAFLGTGSTQGFSVKTIGEGLMSDVTEMKGFRPIVKSGARAPAGSTSRRSAPSTTPSKIGGPGVGAGGSRDKGAKTSSSRRSAPGAGQDKANGPGVSAGSPRGKFNKSTSRSAKKPSGGSAAVGTQDGAKSTMSDAPGMTSPARLEDEDAVLNSVVQRLLGNETPDYMVRENEDEGIDISADLARARDVKDAFDAAFDEFGEEYVTDRKVREAMRRGYMPKDHARDKASFNVTASESDGKKKSGQKEGEADEAESCEKDKKGKKDKKFSIEFFKRKGKKGEEASKRK